MFLTLEVVKKNILDRYFSVFRLACIIFLLCSNANVANAQSQQPAEGKYITRYEDGTLKEKGFYKRSQKHKVWYYYRTNGTIDRKEKWVDGKLEWQIFYNNKGRIIKTIDKDGVIQTRPGCGC